MIVVAIIAIHAAIALPAYQDYTIRSQVSECGVLASGATNAIAETFINTGVPPADNGSWQPEWRSHLLEPDRSALSRRRAQRRPASVRRRARE